MIKSPCKNCCLIEKDIPNCFETCKKLKKIQEIFSSDKVDTCNYKSYTSFDVYTEFNFGRKGTQFNN